MATTISDCDRSIAGVAACRGSADRRPSAQEPLSAAGAAIVAAVNDGNSAALALLERVVNINSGTQNFAACAQVGALFRAEFDALGFKTEWVDGASWNRAGHLVATHPGPSPKVLLIGHLDTVFEPTARFRQLERSRRRSRARSRHHRHEGRRRRHAARAEGAEGGRRARSHEHHRRDDRRRGSARPAHCRSAREALVDGGEGRRGCASDSRMATAIPAHAVIARRGTTSWRLEVTGTAGHSSQVFGPELGAGAIYEAARIVNGFRERLAGEPHLTFNPGVFLGGTPVDFDAATSGGTASGKTNVVRRAPLVTGDLRALTAEQFEKAKQAMRAVVAQSLPRTSAEITFDDGYPPLAPTAGNEKLLVMYDQASRDLGLGSVAGRQPRQGRRRRRLVRRRAGADDHRRGRL